MIAKILLIEIKKIKVQTLFKNKEIPSQNIQKIHKFKQLTIHFDTKNSQKKTKFKKKIVPISQVPTFNQLFQKNFLIKLQINLTA